MEFPQTIRRTKFLLVHSQDRATLPALGIIAHMIAIAGELPLSFNPAR